MNDFLVLVNCSDSNVLLTIDIIFFIHACFIDLFVLFTFGSFLVGLGVVYYLDNVYWLTGSSYLGLLKLKFFLMRPLATN